MHQEDNVAFNEGLLKRSKRDVLSLKLHSPATVYDI
jgi:hypothetical protein